jgi:flavin reductase (DIM6/NTAB) family NADH-FMN oxidoreductase RutF
MIIMKKSLGPKVFGFPAPVFMVGSYNENAQANVMNAAAAGACCLSPPCVYVSLREATRTYHNIMRNKAFTISIPSQEQVVEADYFGMASGKNVDKFEATGLTPVNSDLVYSPYVNEFSVVMECLLKETVNLGSHTMFIGEVIDLKADEDVTTKINVKSDLELVKVDLEKSKPFIYDLSLRGYYKLGEKIGNGFSDGLKYFKK